MRTWRFIVSRPRNTCNDSFGILVIAILLLSQSFLCAAGAVHGDFSKNARTRQVLTSSLDASIGHKSGSTTSGNQWRGGASVVTSSTSSTWKGLSYYSRVALAGGLAGATGTTVLYPMDSAKTLRQANPAQFASVRQALWHLIRMPSTSTSKATWQLPKAYRGWLPAALGAIPSSALYFGAYESSKRAMEKRFGKGRSTAQRCFMHGLAAASGNILSSAVFVPKEVLKQQLQYHASSGSAHEVLWKILREQGVSGLYAGYSATLMRNIPSAMVRFVLYEELKQWWSKTKESSVQDGTAGPLERIPTPIGLFASGAIAGAVASGMMTPVDVIKTRLATGTCPLGVQNCYRHVLREVGWRGLYAGAGSRMLWSGAFSAIGFGTFELVKSALGVSDKLATDNVTEDRKR